MKYFRLGCGCLLCLSAFAMAACKQKPRYQMVGEPSSEQPSATASPSSPAESAIPSPARTQMPGGQSPELSALVKNIRPAIVLVTVFDASGKLLRTGTGFFVTEDGKLLTNSHTAEGGAYAVAKMEDGAIYNVTGILSSSTKLDLALLKVDVKQVPFLPLNKTAKTDIGARVVVVGSALASNEGTPVEGTIYMNKSDRRGDRVGIVAPISASAIGSPVANRNGEIIGIVTTRNEQGEALDLVRPSSAVQSFISEVAPDATARWPEMAQTSPSPHPTPKPSPGLAGRGKSSNERRIVYKPQPNYPFEARSHAPETRTGRFQLHFDATGNVTAVQIVKSTGNDILDRASTKALEQWRSEPGQEWITTIPITFENR